MFFCYSEKQLRKHKWIFENTFGNLSFSRDFSTSIISQSMGFEPELHDQRPSEKSAELKNPNHRVTFNSYSPMLTSHLALHSTMLSLLQAIRIFVYFAWIANLWKNLSHCFPFIKNIIFSNTRKNSFSVLMKIWCLIRYPRAYNFNCYTASKTSQLAPRGTFQR